MRLFKRIILSVVAFVPSLPILAQAELLSSGDIIVKTEQSKKHKGKHRMTSIENLHDTTVVVTFHSKGLAAVPWTLMGKEKRDGVDVTMDRITAHSMRTPTHEIEIFNSSTHFSDTDTEGDAMQEHSDVHAAQVQPSAPTQPIVPTAHDPATGSQTPPATSTPQKLSQPAQQVTATISTTSKDTLTDSCKPPLDSVNVGSLQKSQNISDLQPAKSIPWKMVCVIAGLVLICLLLLLWYARTNRTQHRKQNSPKKPTTTHGNTDSFMVIGKRTQTILRQQSLADVYDNEAYIKIESEEFCQDSAVRAMYLKNTCIKDIYNMYAEDLRNPDNPKEDGCMVLGRWVLDDTSQKYDVTLEHIVLPGDDAVFDEYELNFGGKIKLKVSEKLRKLRRETNLQYDLTCWVHSHPGLGVFFSNYDENVHLQLKHPTHPKFLTAIVIDILTPQLETGIFTFRQDMTVNSKSDIKKMYSFEELYQKALKSERNSFDASVHYDMLEGCREHLNPCYGIHLSNGAIIDMTFLAAKATGFVSFAHGFTIERGERTQCVVTTVSKTEAVADNRVLGCFIVASHCSIPSIRKVVASYMQFIRFVLVYTNDNGLLTAIPVANQDLAPDTVYHGEQNLEELKIWTRRKR